MRDVLGAGCTLTFGWVASCLVQGDGGTRGRDFRRSRPSLVLPDGFAFEGDKRVLLVVGKPVHYRYKAP